MNVRYKPSNNFAAAFSCDDSNPSCFASLRAWNACNPASGSIGSRMIFSGDFSATVSISTPPSVLATIKGAAVARSSRIAK